MQTYTREQLAQILHCDPTDFTASVTVAAKQTQQYPQIYKLNDPVDIGERKPAQYLAPMDGKTPPWALFPTLKSARIAYSFREYWTPNGEAVTNPLLPDTAPLP